MDIGDCHAGKFCSGIANHEMTLTAAPNGSLSVHGNADQAGMGFNVPLVHWLGTKGPFHGNICRSEPGIQITDLEFKVVSDVGRRFRLWRHATREQEIVQHGSIRPHGFFHINHMGKNFVVDLNQCQGLLRNTRGSCRYGCYSMTGIHDLVACHDIAGDVAHVRGAHHQGLV